jgi:hopanoid-associated phosphorylase
MGDVSRPGFIVGLPLEARLLSRAFGEQVPPIFCTGADPTRVPSGVAELQRQGADCLVSFGLAGGLHAALSAGDVILADRVEMVGGQGFALDLRLRKRLASALDAAGATFHEGIVIGVNRIIATPVEKRTIASATAGLAADMESYAMAAAAGTCPVAVLRVVVDPAGRAIPAAVLGALGADGDVRPFRLLAGLLRRPAEIGALIALAGDHGKARRSLARAAELLATVFQRQ